MNRLIVAGGEIVAALAAAALAGAALAGAQPPPNPECTPEPAAATGEQCEQGQPGLPDPQLPKNPNDVATQPTPAQQPPAQQGDLADTNCWVVNGVPRWNAPGTAPAPASTTDVVEWCPTKYGLTPRPR